MHSLINLSRDFPKLLDIMVFMKNDTFITLCQEHNLDVHEVMKDISNDSLQVPPDVAIQLIESYNFMYSQS